MMKRLLAILSMVALVASMYGCASYAEAQAALKSGGSAPAAAASAGGSTAIDMKGPKADFDLKAIAIYTMEAQDNGDMVDDSGNDMFAFIGGDFTQAAGVVGKAMVFNGVDNYLMLPPEVQDGTAWTFAAWVNPVAWPDWARVFDIGDGSASDIWLGFAGVEKKMRCDIFGASATTILGETLPPGKWSHIAVTLDGQNICMYVNGTLTQKGNSAMLPKDVIKKNGYIGRSNWAADPLFKGMIDEVIIANAAYTQDQIQKIARGIPVKK